MSGGTSRLIRKTTGGRRLRIDPQLLFWRRMIDHAVADAKRVRHGVPTAEAMIARWWIVEHNPTIKEGADWQRSFACACGWLSLDITDERKRLIAEVDAALLESYRQFLETYLYVNRAAVLTCAGVPVTICRQYVLPLVMACEYEYVAGIDHVAHRTKRRKRAA